jgi:hypothetical protein
MKSRLFPKPVIIHTFRLGNLNQFTDMITNDALLIAFDGYDVWEDLTACGI